MHTLQLDFQTTNHRIGWLNTLCMVGGLITTSFLAIYYLNLDDAVNNLENRRLIIERNAHSSASTSRLTVDNALNLRAEIKDANAVLAQLSLPWVALFKDIESSSQQQVALLAIIPDAQRRVIKISGEARSLSAVLDYLRNLQKAGSLQGVYLQNHQIEIRTAEKPVRFTIIASWKITP